MNILPGPAILPRLSTFDQRPSWCNLRGGIDRSACIELRVSELRRVAGCVIIDPDRRDRRGRPLHFTAPLDDETPAPRKFADGSQRLTTGTFNIEGWQLLNLHAKRQPRTLAGDFRTGRANAMRELQFPKPGQSNVAAPSTVKPGQSEGSAAARATPRVDPPQTPINQKPRFKCRVTRANPYAWPPDRNLPANPNKGAARSKVIGLNADWFQTLRIEKWHYPRRIQPVYFLICPGHAIPSASPQAGAKRVSRRGTSDAPGPVHCNSLSVSFAVHPPPLSTRKPGREHPSSKRCPQRCLKLLMVQCTEEEYNDAQIAQLWINSIPAHLVPKRREQINALAARYGPICQPRTLLCPRCLGVRYGNHPETVRQGWRRRNNKKDVTVASHLPKLQIALSHRGEMEHQGIREAIELAGQRGDGQARQRQRARRKRIKELQQRDRATNLNEVLQWLQRSAKSQA